MTTITLKASDGHQFKAYEAKPAGPVRGGLVVVQEIFGVNAHIKRVADGFAADGYHVLSPAIFSIAPSATSSLATRRTTWRVAAACARRSAWTRCSSISPPAARRLRAPARWRWSAIALAARSPGSTATRLPAFAATIGYYGGMIAKQLDEKPKCPVMLHFGELDGGIPMTDVAAIKAAVDPKMVQVFSYAGAGHAFNRDGNHAHHEPSAKVARERTLAFLRQHVG